MRSPWRRGWPGRDVHRSATSCAHRHNTRNAGAAAEPAATNARILVVDDDPDVAFSTATLLEIVGYTVASASSGQAVFLDIGLKGGMDGFETARRLRQQQQGAIAALGGVDRLCR